ncbi:MAG: hypothetical protein RL490_117 [Pseudomonadota bacterium]|jgi:uncharacterized protein (UPF0335 family)
MSENVSAEQLRLFIERIESLEEERQGISDDIKDVYAEAKGTGFDTKTMKKIIALRKLDASSRQEADALLDTYRTALGLADEFGGSDEPREDPRAAKINGAIEAEIHATLRTTGRATIVALKGAIKAAKPKDGALKALSYDQLTIHLGNLIARGEITSAPGRHADFPEYWSI